MADFEGVAFLRADVDRFCREIAELAPALRLRRLAELRAMLEEVTGAALIEAMADARVRDGAYARSARAPGSRMSRRAGYSPRAVRPGSIRHAEREGCYSAGGGVRSGLSCPSRTSSGREKL
jgi:hypothetical protein